MLRSTRILGLLLLLLIPSLVLGQTPKAPRVEVFGGFSYLNARTYEREHFFDLATGVTVNVNKHFGLAADVNLPLAGPSNTSFPIVVNLGGSRGFPALLSDRSTTTVSTALAGPRFFSRREKFTLFGHALGGIVRTKQKTEYGHRWDFVLRSKDFVLRLPTRRMDRQLDSAAGLICMLAVASRCDWYRPTIFELGSTASGVIR